MKKTLNIFLGCLAAILSLASCSNDDDPSGNYTTLTYTNCFNYSRDRASGAECLSGSNVGYAIKFDFDNMKADVRVAGLVLADGKDAITLDMNGLPLRMSGGYYRIDATDVVPVVNGTASSKYSVGTFSLAFIQFAVRPTVGTTVLTGQEFGINYTVKDDVTTYNVKAIPNASLYYGETTVMAKNSTEPYVTTAPYYIIRLSLDKDTKVVTPTVEMRGAKFAPSMGVSIDMVLKGATVDFANVSGGYRLTADHMIPEVGGKPNPKYAISNFNPRCEVAKSADISFDVDAMGRVVSKLRYTAENAQSL